MLSYDWDFLSHREKQYFGNDEGHFLSKKAKLYETSALTNEIKSLHAKLKLIDNDKDRQSLAEQLVELDQKRVTLFREIDE